jgi:hypothetical protein
MKMREVIRNVRSKVAAYNLSIIIDFFVNYSFTLIFAMTKQPTFPLDIFCLLMIKKMLKTLYM